jgi:penicillin-binding protein 1A
MGRAAWWLAPRLAVAVAALGAVLAVACVIAYFVITPRTFDLQAIERANRVPGVTFIDATGQILATRGAFHGDQVTLKELPPYLVDAFVATEDRRFYHHFGIDPWGILRAMIVNLRAGHTVQGGSTITQQLAKNLFLSNDRTYTRKFKEMFYAIWLEHHMTKDQILELYLNSIYFGAGTYGIDAASRFYFNKPASQVTLAEAAMLAGLPKAPTKFSPAVNLASAQTRADRVLDNLVDARYMTEAQVFPARANPAVLSQRAELGSIQYYLDYVYGILGDVLGKTAENDIRATAIGEKAPDSDQPSSLGNEDLIVYTTLDTGLQKKAENALLLTLNDESELYHATEGALVSIDPDGAVRAMVGGRSYADSQFNRATDAMRQPGSSFKPFVYLAALESGRWTPDSLVDDAPITIQTPQGPWSPNDYESDYKGRVTLREALADSLNTAAVRISQDVGPDKVAEAAQRLGITSPLQPIPSIALGTQLVSPLEMTGAYLAFARNGTTVPYYTVVKVMTKSGKVLYQYQAPEPRRVIDPQIATEMTNLMYGVINGGTGTNASLGDRPAAGKTGTSSDWRDAWFVGYTANLVTGVWIGNDDNSPMKHVTGGQLPAQIWKSFMVAAHEGVPISPLPGAYATRNTSQESTLKNFYGDLAGSMRAVEQGTSPVGAAPAAESSGTMDEPVQNAPERKRRCLFLSVFCTSS